MSGARRRGAGDQGAREDQRRGERRRRTAILKGYEAIIDAAVLPNLTIDEALDLDIGKTAGRVSKMMSDELLSSYTVEAQEKFVQSLKHFSAKNHDGGMVVVKGIPFYSLCAHHMIPFFGEAAIGYVPRDRIAGLSKLPRVVDFFSHRLQTQEQLGNDVADYLMSWLEPIGAMVILEGRHLCMEMRGVRKPGATTITSAIRGKAFDGVVRQEFLTLIRP